MILGDALWQRSFGGQPMVGRTVTLNMEPYEVVGIAPPRFQFPDGAQAWVPLALPAAAEARRDQHYLTVLGRLADGAHRRPRRGPSWPSSRGGSRRSTRRRTPAVASRSRSFNLGFGDPVLPHILAHLAGGAPSSCC